MPRNSGPGPSVEDPDRYEALRRDGMSKEKAARIANTPPKQAAQHRGSGGSYEDWTKQELYDKAKDVGIEGRSKMSKTELIKALRGGSRS